MKSILALLGGTVALLVVCMLGKFSGEHYAAPRTSGIEGELRHAPVGYLFVGSSHTRQSYDVMALERQTSSSAFLVAYDGMDFCELNAVLPGLLANLERRPRVLIIEGYGVALVRARGIEDSRLFFDSPPRMKWNLLRQVMAGPARTSGWLDAFDLLVNRNNELLLTYPVESRVIDGLSYGGGYIGKTVPGLANFRGLQIPQEKTTPRPAEVQALANVIALARAAHVQIACMGSPMPGPVERQPSIRSLTNRLRALVSARGVAFFDGADDFPVDRPELFADSNHLSTAGRALYTARAAAYLRRHFPL